MLPYINQNIRYICYFYICQSIDLGRLPVWLANPYYRGLLNSQSPPMIYKMQICQWIIWFDHFSNKAIIFKSFGTMTCHFVVAQPSTVSEWFHLYTFIHKVCHRRSPNGSVYRISLTRFALTRGMTLSKVSHRSDCLRRPILSPHTVTN